MSESIFIRKYAIWYTGMRTHICEMFFCVVRGISRYDYHSRLSRSDCLFCLKFSRRDTPRSLGKSEISESLFHIHCSISLASDSIIASGISTFKALSRALVLTAFLRHSALLHIYAPRPLALPLASTMTSPSGVLTILTSSFLFLTSRHPRHVRCGFFFVAVCCL